MTPKQHSELDTRLMLLRAHVEEHGTHNEVIHELLVRVVGLEEQLEAVENSWKMAERALARMDEQLEAAEKDKNRLAAEGYERGYAIAEEQLEAKREEIHQLTLAHDAETFAMRRALEHALYEDIHWKDDVRKVIEGWIVVDEDSIPAKEPS